MPVGQIILSLVGLEKELVETGQYREVFLWEENFKQNFEAVVYGLEKKHKYISE